MDINKVVNSPAFKWVLIALGEIIVLLLVFLLGAMIGFRQANFTVRWGENYKRNFGGPGALLPLGFGPGPGAALDAHGASGRVLKIDGNTIVVNGENNMEKTIIVSDNTVITRQRQAIKVGDVKAGDDVVVIGSPNNQGQIDAKFIRVFVK